MRIQGRPAFPHSAPDCSARVFRSRLTHLSPWLPPDPHTQRRKEGKQETGPNRLDSHDLGRGTLLFIVTGYKTFYGHRGEFGRVWVLCWTGLWVCMCSECYEAVIVWRKGVREAVNAHTALRMGCAFGSTLTRVDAGLDSRATVCARTPLAFRRIRGHRPCLGRVAGPRPSDPT